ncbi:unnamed protein product [Diabrotica balteata]|uniref:Uncharacterized protein n=1 Tax=Diabrotica balteata TaxID=107213 RepID=A0A9N9XDD7_DIABA|nr:unnamed protein product [Diabrotica balteata]
MLPGTFETAGISSSQREGDSDVKIVLKAVDTATTYDKVLIISEDTDILVLLVALTFENLEIVNCFRNMLKSFTTKN